MDNRYNYYNPEDHQNESQGSGQDESYTESDISVQKEGSVENSSDSYMNSGSEHGCSEKEQSGGYTEKNYESSQSGSYAGGYGSSQSDSYTGSYGSSQNDSYAGSYGSSQSSYTGSYGSGQNDSYTGTYRSNQNNGYTGAYTSSQEDSYRGYAGNQYAGYAEVHQEKSGETRRHSREKKKTTGKKTGKVLMVAGLAVLFGVVSSATFLASNIVGSRLLGLDDSSTKVAERTKTTSVGNASLTTSSSVITSDVSAMVESVMPSVVSITNMSVQQIQSFFGGTYERPAESAGTGIIIAQTDDELLIVTNYHVIENNDTLTVAFCDETSATADVKGADQSHDVAVIAVQLDSLSDSTMDSIAIATIGDSTQLKVGEPAIAIGNALGYGQSVTSGVISALNREITTTDEMTGETKSSGVKMIQTDAVINKGNSGGALLNAKGEVIGINSAKLSGDTVEGIGYAIPISDVSDIIDNLMNQRTKRKVAESERGVIGIQGRDIPSESAEWFNMPLGVYVDSVVKGGGAEAAGITKGNIITAINGITIESMSALQDELQYYAAGETVNITVGVPENNGEYSEKTVEVRLGKAS